jgi:serine/threonine-protein kinase
MTSPDLVAYAQSRVGQTLRGKWRIDRLIGVGGMAAVYAATHRNNKRGAVKILHPQMGLNEEVKTRFLREGYVANAVDHPGAVSVLDDDTNDDGSVFLVMELLEGEALDTKLKRVGRLPETEAVGITLAMLEVLAVAHPAGVVHRDLKPDNVFLTTKGQVKILDFGIARLREAAQHSGTQTGFQMGTPQFMPPEQALGDWDRVDGRADLFAVAATAFNMLSGQTFRTGDSVNKILLAAMTHPAPPIRSMAPHVSPAVAAVIDKALSFERDHRWASATEMRDALAAAVGKPAAPQGPPVQLAGARAVAPAPLPAVGTGAPLGSNPSLTAVLVTSPSPAIQGPPRVQPAAQAAQPWTPAPSATPSAPFHGGTQVTPVPAMRSFPQSVPQAMPSGAGPSSMGSGVGPAGAGTLAAAVHAPGSIATARRSSTPWIGLAAVLLVSVGGVGAWQYTVHRSQAAAGSSEGTSQPISAATTSATAQPTVEAAATAAPAASSSEPPPSEPAASSSATAAPAVAATTAPPSAEQRRPAPAAPAKTAPPPAKGGSKGSGSIFDGSRR